MMVVFICAMPDLCVSVCVFYVAHSHSGGRGAVENTRHRGWAGSIGAPGDDGVAQGAIAVDEITLRNYRCFRDEQIARLAPLTLLVGENSTGKTSFMAMIRALWDAAYRSRVPNFKEEPYDLGSFDEIAHHRGARGRRAEEIHSGFSASPRAPRRKGKSTTADGTPARFAVTFHRKGTTPVPRTRRLQGNGTWIEIRDEEPRLSFGTPGGAWSRPSPETLHRRSDAEDDPTLDQFFFAPVLFRRGRNLSDAASTRSATTARRSCASSTRTSTAAPRSGGASKWVRNTDSAAAPTAYTVGREISYVSLSAVFEPWACFPATAAAAQ